MDKRAKAHLYMLKWLPSALLLNCALRTFNCGVPYAAMFYDLKGEPARAADASSLFPRDDIEAIIFTGTDDVFASGANIRELAQLDTEAALQFSKLGQDSFQTIANAR